MAAYQKLEIFRKGTRGYELSFTKDGVAINITDWTVYFTLKEKTTDLDAAAKINKKLTAHTDATNGKSIIPLISSDTDLEPKSYYYSIDFKDDEGNEGVLYYGSYKIKDTTRDTRD